MNRFKKLSLKDRRLYQAAIAAFLLLCVVMGFACFQYYNRLQDTVKTENGEYMQEIAKQMGTNVSKTMSDNFSVLRTVSTVLKSSDVSSYLQLRNVVEEHQNHWNYQKIMLIDENGVAYDDTGGAVALSSDAYVRDVIVSQKASMSPSQVIDGKECIVFAIPLENINIEGTNMAALVGAYDLSTFDTILSMSAFDGKGYAHIIRKDGTIVIRSSSQSALETGYNILTSLSSAKISGGKQIADVKTAIAEGKSGQVEFTLGGAHEYMTHTPLETEGWSLLTFVPVSVVNAKSDMLLKITLLLCGFITFSFALLFGLLMLTFYRNRRKLERIAYVDPVTNGNTNVRFQELAEELLAPVGKPQYAMVFANIEKFKVLNEQFGKKACDEILRGIEYGISSNLEPDECMGRLFADNFCILVKYTDEASIVARFGLWQKGSSQYMEKTGSLWLPLIIEFGVFIIGNDTIPLSHMVDRAKLSLVEGASQLHGKLRYAIYDEQVRRVLFREKQLEDMMEAALENREFQVYLQPKYNTHTEEIGGAEALVRWVSSSEGMIFPDEFIPFFEKNGFVIQLDLFVFEEVCRALRRWRDEGKTPVKISVNCSRLHLKNANFLKKYSHIAQKYNIPENSIEIELTENAVFEDVECLSKIIKEIHEAGFGCSMDDFGSGYSSLNLIQDIPVDTLKLDKVFFKSGSKNLQRTESVVGSIISMSKALSMKTVAEGIEERPQVEMLKRLNCDYIQGYFFARPMPIADFERIAFTKAPTARAETGEEAPTTC